LLLLLVVAVVEEDKPLLAAAVLVESSLRRIGVRFLFLLETTLLLLVRVALVEPAEQQTMVQEEATLVL
jgi:hypothetical protein